MEVDAAAPRTLLWGRRLFIDRKKKCGNLAASDASTPVRTQPMTQTMKDAACQSSQGMDHSLKWLLRDAMAADASKASYVRDVLHPLLKEMVLQAVMGCPDDPAIFFLRWLVGHLSARIPDKLLKHFDKWLLKEFGAPGQSASSGGPVPDAGSPADDEISSLSTPSGPPSRSHSDAHAHGSSSGKYVATPTGQRKISLQLPSPSPDSGSAADGDDDDAQSAASQLAEHHRDSLASVRSIIKSSCESHRSSVVSFCELELPDREGRDKSISWRERFKRRNSRVWKPPRLDIEEIVRLISKVPVFKDLSPTELEAVANLCEIRCFDQDEEIVSLGQKGGDLHIIHAGECEVSVAQHLRPLQPGEWFGEQLFLKSHVASQHRIVASDDRLVAVCLSHDDFERLSFEKKSERWHQLEKGKLTHELKGEQIKRRHNRLQTPYTVATMQHTKSPSDISLIIDAVRENHEIMSVLQLTSEQLKMIAREVVQIKVLMGSNLCEEGVIGDSLYIIHDGIFEVWEQEQLQAKLRNGQSFGEIGLLPGMASTQTVYASRNSTVWQLTQSSLGAILKANPASRVTEYMSMLTRIPLFRKLGKDEIELLADALEEVLFVKYEVILAEGESVSKIYIVYDGKLKSGSGAGASELGKADFFGVDPIVRGSPQADRIQVASETATILTLERSSLELLLDVTFEQLAANGDENSLHLPCQVPTSPTRGKLELQQSSIQKVEKLNSPRSSIEMAREQLRRIGVLGAGSFGFVTLEEEKHTGKWYALKALSKGYCVAKDMKEMVLQERKVSHMLESPFIVHLYQTFKDDQFLYFLYEPALGGDLFEAYVDHPAWFGSAHHAKFFLAGAMFGLEHMHSKKVIYRDLKLENVLLDGSGYPLLTDMGLAKVVIGKTYTVCGTPDYIAPETLHRTGYGRGVDWWALGVMLFMMMSGRSPFDAADSKQIYRNVAKGFKKDYDFPASFGNDLIDVVKGLCRKKPEERLPLGPRGLAHLSEAPWFKGFDWTAMRARAVPPPWAPPALSAEEIVKRSVEAPPVVKYRDDGTGWDDEF